MSIFEELKKYNNGDLIAQRHLKKITGGILCGATMRRLNWMGRGLQNKKIIISNRIYYNINDLIEWLELNAELINF